MRYFKSMDLNGAKYCGVSVKILNVGISGIKSGIIGQIKQQLMRV